MLKLTISIVLTGVITLVSPSKVSIEIETSLKTVSENEPKLVEEDSLETHSITEENNERTLRMGLGSKTGRRKVFGTPKSSRSARLKSAGLPSFVRQLVASHAYVPINVTRRCASDQWKAECEAGDVINRTIAHYSKDGCEATCFYNEACKSYLHTDSMDCALVEVEGETSKAVGISGTDLPLVTPKDPGYASGLSRRMIEWDRENNNLTCDGFHFDECIETPNIAYTKHSKVGEPECLRDCYGDQECNSVMSGTGGTKNCYRSTKNIDAMTMANCGVRTGKVDGNRKLSFQGACVTEGDKKHCQLGYCNLDHLEFLEVKNVEAGNETGCMSDCFYYRRHISGEFPDTVPCTHYRYLLKDGARGVVGDCLLYHLKEGMDWDNEDYHCSAYIMNWQIEGAREATLTCTDKDKIDTCTLKSCKAGFTMPGSGVCAKLCAEEHYGGDCIDIPEIIERQDAPSGWGDKTASVKLTHGCTFTGYQALVGEDPVDLDLNPGESWRFLEILKEDTPALPYEYKPYLYRKNITNVTNRPGINHDAISSWSCECTKG